MRICREPARLPIRVIGLVLLGVMGVLAAAPSAGATFGFSGTPGGGVLAAGSSARLTWSLPAGRGGGSSEMELVLSLDGGRTFRFRVSRELSPATLALDWRVPALPSRRARLALRVGNDNAPEEEEIVLISEEFAIEAGPFSRLEPAVFRRGEWHTVEALEEGEDASQPFPSVHPETRPAFAPVGHSANGSKRLPRPAAASEKSASRAAAFKAVSWSDQAARRTCQPRVRAGLPRRE